MVGSFTDDFQVEWLDPGDGELYWGIDRIHFQRPFPALSRAVLTEIMTIAFGRRTVFVNGYAYMHNYGPPESPDYVFQRGAFRIWQEEFEPLVRAACTGLRAPDYDAWPAAELARGLPDLLRRAAEAFRYTTIVILAFTEPVMDLLEFCEAQLGPEGPTFVASLLQGVENETAMAGKGLSRLTRLAAGSLEVAAALKARRFSGLEGLPGGREFTAELRRFLATYGWRCEDWSLLHAPTWQEEPERALEHVARYLEDPARLPDAALARSREEQERARREVEARLPAAERGRFQELLQRSLGHVPMSEERAFWQLTILGSLRVPIMALGRKLAAAGIIDAANDVFFLEPEECLALAEGPQSRSAQVSQRKAELKRQEQLSPPVYLGRPLNSDELSPLMRRFVRHFRGSVRGTSVGATSIRGLGGSKGRARGTARVLRDLGDSQRLQPGEILVCPTTSPPWTPLFAIAAGVVTDTGGILSHSAICAREYAIPCVVGAQEATRRIPDGATISIDGATGEIVIEGGN